jgi:SAM-dependent methyltransferase
MILSQANIYAKNFPVRPSDSVVFENFLTLLSELSIDLSRPIHSPKSSQEIILDVACGTGESALRLQEKNPDSLVIGVERSPHRLQKSGLSEVRCGVFRSDKDSTQKAYPILLQMDVTRFWILCFKEKIKFQKQMIFYPNPYPKPKLLQKRWYAHPLFSLICSMSESIELRTNLFYYVKTFDQAFQLLTDRPGRFAPFIPSKPISPFERKYLERHSCLWRWHSGL